VFGEGRVFRVERSRLPEDGILQEFQRRVPGISAALGHWQHIGKHTHGQV